MKQYEVIPHKVWKHTNGRTASVYGACPWANVSEENNWQMIDAGYVIRDNFNNTVGMGRRPFKSFDAAQALIDSWD